jgi:hypothetical protein
MYDLGVFMTRMGIDRALVTVDGLDFEFVRISSSEFQFSRVGDVPTNYVVE